MVQRLGFQSEFWVDRLTVAIAFSLDYATTNTVAMPLYAPPWWKTNGLSAPVTLEQVEAAR
jgi:hypothetical protein